MAYSALDTAQDKGAPRANVTQEFAEELEATGIARIAASDAQGLQISRMATLGIAETLTGEESNIRIRSSRGWVSLGGSGSPGPAGPKGDTGSAGPKGDTGDTGEDGGIEFYKQLVQPTTPTMGAIWIKKGP